MLDETEQTDLDHPYAEEPEGSVEQSAETPIDEQPAEEDVVTPLEPEVFEAPEDDDLGGIVESLEDDEPLPAQLADEPEADQPTSQDASDVVVEPEAAQQLEDEVESDAETAAEEPVEPEGEPEVAEAGLSPKAPEADATDSASAVVVIDKPRSPVPRWPFWTLAGAWLALCAGAAYVLTRDPAMPTLRQDVYTFVVAAGLALTILGPIMAVVVWLFARSGAGQDRPAGMFATSLMRAALVTFFGVITWTGVLILVDALRLGLIRF